MRKQSGRALAHTTQIPPCIATMTGQSKRLCLIQQLLPSLVNSQIKPNNSTPSLHSHYRNFLATTSCSAPVLRIGTLVLGDLPLGFLPYHQSDRFPQFHTEAGNQTRATFMPDTTHPVSRSPMDLSQVNDSPLVLMSSLRFRHVISGSLAFAFLIHT